MTSVHSEDLNARSLALYHQPSTAMFPFPHMRALVDGFAPLDLCGLLCCTRLTFKIGCCAP